MFVAGSPLCVGAERTSSRASIKLPSIEKKRACPPPCIAKSISTRCRFQHADRWRNSAHSPGARSAPGREPNGCRSQFASERQAQGARGAAFPQVAGGRKGGGERHGNVGLVERVPHPAFQPPPALRRAQPEVHQLIAVIIGAVAGIEEVAAGSRHVEVRKAAQTPVQVLRHGNRCPIRAGLTAWRPEHKNGSPLHCFG